MYINKCYYKFWKEHRAYDVHLVRSTKKFCRTERRGLWRTVVLTLSVFLRVVTVRKRPGGFYFCNYSSCSKSSDPSDNCFPIGNSTVTSDVEVHFECTRLHLHYRFIIFHKSHRKRTHGEPHSTAPQWLLNA